MDTRKRLLDERSAIVHRVEIEGGHKGYIIVGMYDDNRPGELFIVMSKEGSPLSGLLDGFSVSVSLLLQNGVSLSSMVKKFANTKFEPSGRTKNPCIPETSSIADYVFRMLGLKFLPLEELQEIGVMTKCHGCDKSVRLGDMTYACNALPQKS
jgi:ribonucleoside-diphosphate reductase alpha chain